MVSQTLRLSIQFFFLELTIIDIVVSQNAQFNYNKQTKNVLQIKIKLFSHIIVSVLFFSLSLSKYKIFVLLCLIHFLVY